MSLPTREITCFATSPNIKTTPLLSSIFDSRGVDFFYALPIAHHPIYSLYYIKIYNNGYYICMLRIWNYLIEITNNSGIH